MIPTTPAVADRPPWKSIQTVQGTPVSLTANVTNTAVSATLITGLTDTFTVVSRTQYFLVILQADQMATSGSGTVALSLWNGTVGTGTQVGQATIPNPGDNVSVVWVVPVTAAQFSTSITLNVGVVQSSAGTFTLTAGTTNPCTLTVLAV